MWTFGGWGGVNLYLLGGVSHNCHLGEVFSQAVTGYFALILNRKSFSSNQLLPFAHLSYYKHYYHVLLQDSRIVKIAPLGEPERVGRG